MNTSVFSRRAKWVSQHSSSNFHMWFYLRTRLGCFYGAEMWVHQPHTMPVHAQQQQVAGVSVWMCFSVWVLWVMSLLVLASCTYACAPEVYRVCRHNCLNCWDRDLVKAIIIQPGHICLLSTQSICLKDTNDCNLTAIEEDCNELVTICLMWVRCSKVRRIIKGVGLYFHWHYVQWQQWRLMSMRFISFSELLPFCNSYFSVFPNRLGI